MCLTTSKATTALTSKNTQVYVTGLCYRFMLQVYVTGLCYRFMLQVYVTGLCYRFMLQVYVTGLCYRFMLQVYVTVNLLASIQMESTFLRSAKSIPMFTKEFGIFHLFLYLRLT